MIVSDSCTIADSVRRGVQEPGGRGGRCRRAARPARAESRLLESAGDHVGAATDTGLKGGDELRALQDPTRGVGVREPVGVEDQRVAGGELGGVVGQLGVGHQAEQRPGLPERLDPSVGSQGQRQRVAADRRGSRGAPSR